MFPAQTSLIPVAIALARFAENDGLGAMLTNYPYWYLGSTPFRFLTGPIVPMVLVVIHRFSPNLSLFEIMFGLIVVVWLIGGVGVYLLARSLANSFTVRGVPSGHLGGVSLAHFYPFPAAVFYLFGPIMPLLFPFADGVYLLAFSTLPFILFFYLKFLKKPSGKLKIVLVALITFSLLIDTLIIPSLFLGMTAIFLAQVGWKKAEEKFKGSLVLLFFSFLVATFWYTPGYWWTLLTAPSFGGKGLGQVIIWLGKLLPIALALTLAVFSVRFFKKRELLRDFCFFWFFIFGFLTLIRFFSDPDFWLDWSGYGLELQLGGAIGLGIAVFKILNSKLQIHILNLKYIFYFLCIFTIYFLQFAIIFNKYVLGTLQKDITQTVEYRVGRWLLENIKPGERVFLSGTTAFWLNAFFDIPQVRGGRDQVSVDPRWREAAWEIRDGSASSPQEVQKSVDWLKKLNISYLVVHNKDSAEYYHDFKIPQKFEGHQGFKKVFSDHDSTIYMVLGE